MADPTTIDQWKSYVDVNLTGNFALAQAVIPYMRVEAQEDKRKLPDSKVGGVGPCIVFVSSFRGVVSDPNQEGYAATKAGLIGLASAMAVSMQDFGIRVNCVSPGRIRVTHENKEADENGGEWKLQGDDAEVHVTNR
jgi:ribonuclease Z